VVNDCLEKYFTELKVPESTLRKKRRIRCIAWATTTPKEVKWKEALGFMLAVINDHQEVIFLNISSSSQLKGDSAQVLGHYDHVVGEKKSRQRTYEVSWSSWIPCETSIQASISCRIGGCSSAISLGVKVSQVCQPCTSKLSSQLVQCLLPSKGLLPAAGTEATSQDPRLEFLVKDVSDDGDLSQKPLLLSVAHNHLRSPQWDIVSGRASPNIIYSMSYKSSRTLLPGRSLLYYYPSFAYGDVPL